MIFALVSLADEVPGNHAVLVALPAYGLSVSYYLLPIRREISPGEMNAPEGCSPPASPGWTGGGVSGLICAGVPSEGSLSPAPQPCAQSLR